jgi:hypothetical protein
VLVKGASCLSGGPSRQAGWRNWIRLMDPSQVRRSGTIDAPRDLDRGVLVAAICSSRNTAIA